MSWTQTTPPGAHDRVVPTYPNQPHYGPHTFSIQLLDIYWRVTEVLPAEVRTRVPWSMSDSSSLCCNMENPGEIDR